MNESVFCTPHNIIQDKIFVLKKCDSAMPTADMLFSSPAFEVKGLQSSKRMLVFSATHQVQHARDWRSK